MGDEPDASDAPELTPDRAAYLRHLRKQIRAGTYHVDAEALAKKLLEKAGDEILPPYRSEDEAK